MVNCIRDCLSCCYYEFCIDGPCCEGRPRYRGSPETFDRTVDYTDPPRMALPPPGPILGPAGHAVPAPTTTTATTAAAADAAFRLVPAPIPPTGNSSTSTSGSNRVFSSATVVPVNTTTDTGAGSHSTTTTTAALQILTQH